MSAISQKSISGITSITSPAGTDDQISLHTSNTNEALKIDGAGNLHLNNHVNTTGVSTASNFKTGSSNLHSTGLNVGDTFVHSTGINGSSADIDDFISVGTNIHLGNAGVVTATSFSGSGANLTSLPAQATIANNADNRVITGGSGVNLNGESNLTYDGTNLQLVTDANNEGIKLNSTLSGGSSYPVFEMDANRSVGNTLGKLISKWNGTEVASIQITSGTDGTNKDDAHMYFNTASAGTATERLRITSTGNVGINETSPQQQLHVHDDTTYHGIFVNGSAAPRITFARQTTTTGEWSVGIDGTNGNNFAINNSGDNSNNKIVISSSQVSLYGNVSVPNGNIVMGNTRGIDFSATSDSSGNTSELLDDYEEGSFTPQFDGLSNTPSYAARNGRYTKIGRYVHITGIIQTGGTNPTFSSTTNVLKLTGMPFAGFGVMYYVSLGNVSHQHWDCYGTGNNEGNYASGDADFLYSQMEHNTTNMMFMMGKGSQTRARVRNNSMHNSGAIILFELSYTVA